jgi:two-component sensor histidine kinase
MATLAELARHRTSLGRAQIAHLQRLVAEWGMLADFCFADLLLLAPVVDSDSWLVLGQIRPTTGQTMYRADWVGEVLAGADHPLVAEAWDTGEIVVGDMAQVPGSDRVRVAAIPVRHDGAMLGVLTREWSPSVGRQPGELERTYLEVFERFARMIADGDFPFAAERSSTAALPRVGDGVMLLDASQRVEYASPNAVSALHRAGVQANAVGMRLAAIGFDDHPVQLAFESAAPATEEIEQVPEVIVLVRCLPLLKGGKVSGGVVLVRDISELRRRDRMLLSKDATIREIHHRVKNNLQTISSLLRLQGRRLESAEAKAAVEESVRRIRTIALVHETLSRDVGDDIDFNDILLPLAAMVEEGLQSPDRPVRLRISGNAGRLSANVATPLAVVLTELLQNAVEHAFVDGRPGTISVDMANDGSMLAVTVSDDGVGLPDDFRIEDATGLGLSIVRTLVTTELLGTIDMVRADPGTVVSLRMLIPDSYG